MITDHHEAKLKVISPKSPFLEEYWNARKADNYSIPKDELGGLSEKFRAVFEQSSRADNGGQEKNLEQSLSSVQEIPEKISRVFKGESEALPKEDKYKEVKKLLSQAFEIAKNLSPMERAELQNYSVKKLEPGIFVPPLPKPDMTGKSYALYKKGTDEIKHLESVWGNRLKIFNSDLDRDYLTTIELEKLDPKLLTRLRHVISKAKSDKNPINVNGVVITSINQLVSKHLSEDPTAILARHYYQNKNTDSPRNP